MKKIIAVVVLGVAVAGTAIWKFSGESGVEHVKDAVSSSVILADHSDHLALIPADTLFYVGSLKPVSAKDMMASMSSMYQFADPSMQPAMDELFNKADSAGGKFAVSLINFFLNGLNDPQAMFEQTGAKDTLFSSVYSVGLAPVMRYEADQQRFEQFLDKLEADAQISAVSKQLDGVAYRVYPLVINGENSFELIAAYHDGDALFTLAMVAEDQQNLRIALGLEKPASSLKDTGTVQQMQDDYGYLPDSLAYFSVKEVITALTTSNNRAGQTLAALDNGSEPWMSEMRSPVCATELAEIADTWPRWVTGYRELEYSEKGFSGDFHMNIEIKHDALNATLQKLRGHLPADLSSGAPQILSMALGLDVSKLDQILGEMAAHAEALQYQCSLLQPLNGTAQSINSVRPMVAMSTGMARGLKGLRLSLFDIEGDLAAGEEVTDIDAILSLSGDQIRAFVNILMAMNPDAGMLDIPTDGSPVAMTLPAELVKAASKPIEAMLAVKENHAVLFSGDTSADMHAGVLNEALNEDGLLFFSMDYGKYMKLVGGFMDAAAQAPEVSAEEKAQMEKFRTAFAAIDYKETVLMRFTDKGLEFSGNIDINNQ